MYLNSVLKRGRSEVTYEVNLDAEVCLHLYRGKSETKLNWFCRDYEYLLCDIKT